MLCLFGIGGSFKREPGPSSTLALLASGLALWGLFHRFPKSMEVFAIDNKVE